MPTMIDLKATYGDTYRITRDESAKISGQTRDEQLWNLRISCDGDSHIYVHGANTLGAFTSRQRVRFKLEALPGVTVHQRGDSELAVIFAPEILPDVAKLLGAKKRVHLTLEQREAAITRLAKFQFPGKGAHQAPDDTHVFDLREAQDRSLESG
jgi:hypothetical protein